METSRKVSRVSGQQLEILWDFLNSNKDIATSFNRSLQAKEYSQRKWKEIADILNSQGDGVYKDWKGWSKYWIDYKGKLKSRVASVRASLVRSCGGPSIEKPLTDTEEKFLHILGEDFVQGFVSVEPFLEKDSSSVSATPSITRSPRRLRRSREQIISQQAARRALVRSSQKRAEAAMRINDTLKKLVQKMTEFHNTAIRIERVLSNAFLTDVERDESE